METNSDPNIRDKLTWDNRISDWIDGMPKTAYYEDGRDGQTVEGVYHSRTWRKPADHVKAPFVLLGVNDKELFKAIVLKGSKEYINLCKTYEGDACLTAHFWFPPDAPDETPVAFSLVNIHEVRTCDYFPVSLEELVKARRREDRKQ